MFLEEKYGVCAVCGQAKKMDWADQGPNKDTHRGCLSLEQRFGGCVVCGQAKKMDWADQGPNKDTHEGCMTVEQKFGVCSVCGEARENDPANHGFGTDPAKYTVHRSCLGDAPSRRDPESGELYRGA
jgi:hypothetical protein